MFRIFVASLEKYVGSSKRLVWDQVVYPVIDCDKKGGEPQVVSLVIINVSAVGDLSMLT